MDDLAGKVAVVTGGASGIGLAMATKFAAEGMKVVLADIERPVLVAAGEELSAAGADVLIVPTDVSMAGEVAALAATTLEHFGDVHLVCNNAAIHPMATIAEMDLAVWNEAFRVNVSGAFLCSKLALPHMKEQGAGTIVNIGSVSGVSPYVGGGAYAVTKAALAMLTRVLALEAGPFGVTANCICPGSIQHRTERPGSASHIPVGRAGTIDDVASLVIYLASAEARYMTGATLVLDGGATAGRQRGRTAVERLLIKEAKDEP